MCSLPRKQVTEKPHGTGLQDPWEKQLNNEMSELIALRAPFPAVLGVPSYLYFTVFFSHHKDVGSGTGFAARRGGTEQPGRVAPHGAAHRRLHFQSRGHSLNSLPLCLLLGLQKQSNRKTLCANTSMQRAVLETVVSAKCKKGILPKGNDFCQTMSYQIPSRWNLYFEATLCPEELC